MPTLRVLANDGALADGQGAVRRGDYFGAVRAFLEDPPHHRLADAVSRRIDRTIAHADLDVIDIFLEKHGQYYHPARVETTTAGRTLNFVVNAAVSTAGKTVIEADYRNMRRINHRFAHRFLPRVYHLGEVRTGSGQPDWILFLGQWLEGFHEFHLHRLTEDGTVGMVVWDPRHGSQSLNAEQTASVYCQVARILTVMYNLMTSEHIGAWHHAAGDFVLRTAPPIDLKLVTVRQYRPLFRGSMEDIETVFQALLVFLLNLSVRTRIDRDNGTGDLLWSEELAVPATIDGFFEGLELQVRLGLIPETLPDLFRAYLQELTATELADLLVAAVARHTATGAESNLVRRQLHRHAQSMQSAI